MRISRKDNPPDSKSNKLQAEKQKAKRKEKRKERVAQLKKDFAPILKHLGGLANHSEASTTEPRASTLAQAGISPPSPVSVPSLTQRSPEAATKLLFRHLGNLANPVDPHTTTGEASSLTPPARASSPPLTPIREAEDATAKEEPELVVNISDQERAAPPSPTVSHLKSVVVVVNNRKRTSSRRKPYDRR